MTDANVQDTPQAANPNDTSAAFQQGTEGSSGELSVNDIILGTVQEQDNTAPAFTQPETETPEGSNQEQPAQVESQEQPEMPAVEGQDKNDPTRYQYWQSKAGKLENELRDQKARIDNLAAAQAQAPQQQQEVPQQEVKEEFPPPPPKPQRPSNFSREEAYTDSSSESAKYLDGIEQWRDTMDEYNTLRTQYETAKVQEKIETIESERQAEIKKAQVRQEQVQKTRQVADHVQKTYGMNEQEAQDFITTMASPESLTMDNLVQLYRMKQGGSQVTSPQTQSNAQPSADFQQAQRAQQIPSPMGVMPSSGNQDSRSAEDQVMDSMISDFKSKNPFSQ
jgi:hypothetical protein